MIHSSLKITLCADAADAVAQGFNYAAKPDEFHSIEIERVVVIANGTVNGRSTVDLILRDPKTGQKYVAMLTGRLLKSIPIPNVD